MAIDDRDKEILAVSVPMTDYLQMREELDRLEDSVNRLERVVEAMIELYRSERVKSWEMILQEMLKKEEGKKKGNYGNRTG